MADSTEGETGDDSAKHHLRVAIHHALTGIAEAMPAPLDSHVIVRLVRLGHAEPDKLSMNQIRKLCASVAAHNARTSWKI